MKNTFVEDRNIPENNLSDILVKLGMKIKLARVERKLSVLQLSQICGISDSHLSHIENGKVKAPSVNLYLKIFYGLDMKPSEFFGILDELPPFDSKKKRKG